MKWVRAQDGAIFGVCKGIARALDISVGLVRVLWILSVLFFGAGIWLYLILAISFPRADKSGQALEPYLLGVCSKIAMRTNLEVGIVRFLTISLALMSFGATIIGYIILYFVLDRNVERTAMAQAHSSSSSPDTPRVTT